MDKFSVLACMLIREVSLKTKDSVYRGGFSVVKSAHYTQGIVV